MRGSLVKRVPNPNGAPKKDPMDVKVQVQFCIKKSIFDKANGLKGVQKTCIEHLEVKTGISNK